MQHKKQNCKFHHNTQINSIIQQINHENTSNYKILKY